MAPSALFSSCITSSNSINFPLFSLKFSKLKPSATAYIPLLKITSNWTSLSSEINTHIIKHLPKTALPAVTEPMHRLVSAAPPSVASALCLAACELVGGEKSHAMSAACAVQLMHAAAHAHAQPCRSGVDLMTADGLFPLGYEIVAASSSDGGGCGDPETAVRVLLEIARAMGPQGGVVEGQLMAAEGGGESYWAWERKGGRMAACGAACGAIAGGGREEEVERLRRFGMYVGMVNEIMSSSSDGNLVGECDYREVVEMFKSLARLELQGFEEGRVDGVVGLFQLWKINGRMQKQG